MIQSPAKSVSIDEEGFPLFGELRITDEAVGAEILQGIHLAENGSFATRLAGELYTVEAFDAPWVLQSVERKGHELRALLPYHLPLTLNPSSFSVDEWDRFHGKDPSGVPYVFSRKAQAQLFDAVDEFSDESITLGGQEYVLGPWLKLNPEAEAEGFWADRYHNGEPEWELHEAAPALKDMLPRLKLPRSRVLILGCGSGNDAAFFAEQGHIVTAVDYSGAALSKAQQKYGHLPITWIHADLFGLPPSFHGQFDVVFEHTCFCAIAPNRRNDLVKIWSQCLTPGGLLMGVFFVMDRAKGPPFGGTEWEVRQRLQSKFHFLFWGRWKQSTRERQGKELFVYAKLKNKN